MRNEKRRKENKLRDELGPVKEQEMVKQRIRTMTAHGGSVISQTHIHQSPYTHRAYTCAYRLAPLFITLHIHPMFYWHATSGHIGAGHWMAISARPTLLLLFPVSCFPPFRSSRFSIYASSRRSCQFFSSRAATAGASNQSITERHQAGWAWTRNMKSRVNLFDMTSITSKCTVGICRREWH